MDPYRSNLETRVHALEEKLKSTTRIWEERQDNIERDMAILEGQGHPKSGFIAKVFELLNNSWPGMAGVAIVAAVAFNVPSCITAMSDSPEDLRAHAEREQNQIEYRETACQGLGMHYLGQNSYNSILTCGNEHSVATIHLDDHGDTQVEFTTFP